MPEKGTVYILGAGFNQCIKDWHGLKPPLVNNFFQTILQSPNYKTDTISQRLDCVYKYINKYWKKSKQDLLNQPFNLEDCFTLLELQSQEANQAGDKDKMKELFTISFRLKTLLSKFLSEFVVVPKWYRDKKPNLLRMIHDEPLAAFAAKVYTEKPIIITFNYDCFLEDAVTSASGLHPATKNFINGYNHTSTDIPDKFLSYSHCSWNLPLAYGFKFEEVSLQIAGGAPLVSGQRFYSRPENGLYNWKILKLHGSLNWFRYTQSMITEKDRKSMQLPTHKQGDIYLGSSYFDFNMSPMQDSWFVTPLMITPVLHKEIYYATKPFPELWDQAKFYLTNCARLIIIGYSFSPTDFAIRKLLLEAFEANKLEELIVVNPDTSVVRIIKDLVHFTKPVLVCYDLKEFLKI